MNFKQYFLLLEKDHRSKMKKFGVPDDVAEYLHEFNDKYSLWFADKFMKMPDFQAATNKINFILNRRDEMVGILDWVTSAQNIRINDYTWDEALAAQEEFHRNIQTANITDIEHNTLLKQYKDGFYWVDLETSCSSEESSSMGHCGNTSADTLFSLRKIDPVTHSIESFITIGISPDEHKWYQCKGKRNSKPKEEYFSYIADILVHSDVYTYKGEYQTHLDFTNIDLKKYLEDNPDEFENSDEFIEKIEGNNVNRQMFDNALHEKKLEVPFDVSILDYDENDEVNIEQSFFESFTYEELGISSEDVDEISYNEKEKFREVINKCISSYLSDLDVEFGDDGLKLYGQVELSQSDSSFVLSEDGLSSFKGFLSGVARENEDYNRAKILSNIHFLFEFMGIVEESDFSRINSWYVENTLSNFEKDMPDRRSHGYNKPDFSWKYSVATKDIESDMLKYVPKSEIPARGFLHFKTVDSGFNTITVDVPNNRVDFMNLYDLFWYILIEDYLKDHTFKVGVYRKDEKVKFFIYKVYKRDIVEEGEEVEDHYSFEDEMEKLTILNNHLDDIKKAFHKFETQVIANIEWKYYTMEDYDHWKYSSMIGIDVFFKDGKHTWIATTETAINYFGYSSSKLKEAIPEGEEDPRIMEGIADELESKKIIKYLSDLDIEDYKRIISDYNPKQLEFKFESFKSFFLRNFV